MRVKQQKYLLPSWQQKASFWRAHSLCLQFALWVQGDYSGSQKARLLWLFRAKCSCSCPPSWPAPGGRPLLPARFLPTCCFSALRLLLSSLLVCHSSLLKCSLRMRRKDYFKCLFVFHAYLLLCQEKHSLIKMQKQDPESNILESSKETHF